MATPTHGGESALGRGMSQVEVTEMSTIRTHPTSNPEAEKWIQTVIETLGTTRSVCYIKLEGYLQRVESCREDIFASIRSMAGVNHHHYVKDMCGGPLQQAPRWKERTSGFWVTATGRFHIEHIKTKQALFLINNADKFLEHFTNHPSSFLNRFCGVYNIGFLHANSHQADQNCYIVVVKNNFPQEDQPMDYMYRLKGLDKDKVVKRSGIQHQVLRDSNFIDEQQIIMVQKETQQQILSILNYDCIFLEDLSIVNYSLALGIRKLPEGGGETTQRHSSADHSHRGCFQGWRLSHEKVEYHFWIIHCHVYYKTSWTEWVRKPLLYRPAKYRDIFYNFIEDRISPINDEADLGWEALAHRTRVKGDRHRNPQTAEGYVNTLSLLAYSEWEDSQGATYNDVARWRALVDVLEVGPMAVGLWRDLGLVEIGFDDLLPVLRADMERRPLPHFVGQEQAPTGIAESRINQLLKTKRAARTVGGDHVSSSSTQYGLALAIAVGVEAATRCSKKIAERSKQIFKNHPSLWRRPAAHIASRRFFLPEAGSWLSPPHMLPDLHFVEHAPEVFKEIRILMGFDDDSYERCVCARDFSFIEFKSNSKSGEFFFFTHDGRCMVKTVSFAEGQALIKMLQMGYLEHLESREGSLLTRILGLYEVKLPWFNSGKPQYFIVQENLFMGAGDASMHKFDLKGSTYKRRASDDEGVKKDENWQENKWRFSFGRDLGRRLMNEHRRDCQFLAASGVIDYSLLAGFIEHESTTKKRLGHRLQNPIVNMMIGNREGEDGEGAKKSAWDRVRNIIFDPSKMKFDDVVSKPNGRDPHGPHRTEDFGGTYFIGIIDFLIPWSLKKRIEFLYRFLQGNSRTASVNPPQSYADRQIEFLKAYWLAERRSAKSV